MSIKNFMQEMHSKQKDRGEANVFTLSIILIGVFPGLGVLFFIGDKTMARVDTIVNFAIIAGAIAFVIHLPLLKRMNRYLAEIIGYSLFGWGLIIAALFMGCNYVFHGPPVTDMYQVETATAHPENRELPFPVSVTLKQYNNAQAAVQASAYNDYSAMLMFSGADEQKFGAQPATAKMTTAKGLLGYTVLLYKELD